MSNFSHQKDRDAEPSPQREASIGERIRAARKEAGLNQGELAQALGISQPTVANWESDVHNPRQQMLARIAQTLNASLGWLASGDEQSALSASHPVTSYLKLGIQHVPILTAELIKSRQSLHADRMMAAATGFIPFSGSATGSLFALQLDPAPFEDEFPGHPLLIFDTGRTQPEMDHYGLCAGPERPALFRWTTALNAGASGEILGTLIAAWREF